jgi:DNA-binding IclR family transcriptional regulator
MAADSHDFIARQPAAVDSAFAVLEAVARLGPGVTARELTEALPMSRASVYRIIKHLVGSEYLVRTPDLRGFVIGERVQALSRPSVGVPLTDSRTDG